MYVISDHTSSLYLFLIPLCPCWEIRTSRRPGAPEGPLQCAPWKTCGGDRSSRASSHTPPARSRSGRRHLQQTTGRCLGDPGTKPLPYICIGKKERRPCVLSSWKANFSTLVKMWVLTAQQEHAQPYVLNSFDQGAASKKAKLKIQTHLWSHTSESQEISIMTLR